MSTRHIPGQHFGPGAPSHGLRVQVELRTRHLVLLDAQGHETEVLYSQTVPRPGGWDHGALLLDFTLEGATHTLLLQRDGLALFKQHAPIELQRQLGGQARARHQGLPRGFLIAGGAVLAAAALLLVFFFTQFDRVVDAAAARIPKQWEERMGALTAETITTAMPRRPEGAATQMLEDLGGRLAASAASPYTFRWILVDSPQVNAMAAPGGFVIVFTGLLRRAQSAEEVAGVLAHEVQHVVLRHSLRGLVRNLGWRVTLSLLLSGAGDLGAPVAAWAEQLGSLRFSRDQETEADEHGVRLLRQAGIDPRGLATFFERLSQDKAEPPAFLSTHPASDGRAARVRAWIGDFQAPPLPYDWQTVQADLQTPVAAPAR